MNKFDLPEDTVAFLGAGKQFKYDPRNCEPGEVKLKHLDDLKLGEVWIDTNIEGDPHFGEEGYYAIPAVSLTGECEAYDPEFILLWLPHEKCFGSWDCDHWILSIFDDVRWADIVKSPALYLNAQWDPDSEVCSQMKPWQEYEFKSGRPF
jgi:hypothetical protein